MSYFLGFAFLAILGAMLVAIAVGMNVVEAQRKRQVANILGRASGKEDGERFETSILRDVDPSAHPFLAALEEWNMFHALGLQVQQSGLGWSVPGLITATAAFALIGFIAGWVTNLAIYRATSALMGAAVLAPMPLWWMRRARRKRFFTFESQFPEALDFLARSMRAGHAFSVALEMLGDETPDPLGREFRTLFNEQNLGAPLDVALGGMALRVPIVDVRFFVSAVMLQRQTGGNLSEILTQLAHVIRERFRLRGQVKAASAHGRITAAVLTAMPIVTAMALMFVAPGYLQSMAHDPDGKYMILGAICSQLVGYWVIRRIIDIKV
jgi:tight adherence protein B